MASAPWQERSLKRGDPWQGRAWEPIARRQDEIDAIDLPSFEIMEEDRLLNVRSTELRRQIVATPAASPAGVELKMRMFRWCRGGDDHIEEDIRSLADEHPYDATVAWSIALDLARLNAVT